MITKILLNNGLIKGFNRNSLLKSLAIIFTMVSLVIALSGDVYLAYDMNASHSVNQKLDMDKEKKEIWTALRKLGYSEQATAGIMGNWMQESGCNRTVTQGHISWSKFKKGKTGLGLAQWTYHTRQDALFKKADKMGKQWMDLNVQLSLFEDEMSGCSFKSVGGLSGFKKLKDVNKATVVFENVYERAGVKAMDNRKKYANEIFKKYAGTKVTSGSTSSDETGSSDSEVTDMSDGETDTLSVNISTVVTEWDLTGMPSKSGLLSDAYYVELPEYEYLSTGEKYSLSVIKEDIITNNSYDTYEVIRTSVVFAGLCLIFYSVLMAVAYLFDRTNNVFEISLVQIMTFGKLRYTGEDEEKLHGYVGKRKISKICIACMIIGFVIVSGAVFSLISDVLYWFSTR